MRRLGRMMLVLALAAVALVAPPATITTANAASSMWMAAVYEHAWYGGNAFQIYVGDEGPCDTIGYSRYFSGFIHAQGSSIKVFGKNCNTTTVWGNNGTTQTGCTQGFGAGIGSFYPAINDKLYKARWRYSSACGPRL